MAQPMEERVRKISTLRLGDRSFNCEMTRSVGRRMASPPRGGRPVLWSQREGVPADVAAPRVVDGDTGLERPGRNRGDGGGGWFGVDGGTGERREGKVGVTTSCLGAARRR